jgi:hypothetical protein
MAHVVVDLHGPDAYLASSYGVLGSFTAIPAERLVRLRVADHERKGWKLDIWALPPGCHTKNGTEQSVSCA